MPGQTVSSMEESEMVVVALQEYCGLWPMISAVISGKELPCYHGGPL
jgi:hypothetical protein